MHERIIGRYAGNEAGPLLICIGAMHGNEPSGVRAIEEVCRLLAQEPEVNPGFHYRGAFLGLIGNVHAYKVGRRFIDRDLNRMLEEEELAGIRQSAVQNRNMEDLEALRLVDRIEEEIARVKPTFTLILDLHTTTADGGLFTICADDPKSIELAKGLHVPVILGIAENLPGTTIAYFNRPAENRHCIVFEAGQHQDPACVHRSVAAIVNCMRSIGSVDPKDVDHRHDGLLIRISEGLPKVTRLAYHYHIQPGEEFVMRPGYRNFHRVRNGEVLASNGQGEIASPMDALMLMPKYQPLGDDGFFLIEAVEPA
jgi:succinylglutamate desuccinylase